MIVFDLKCADDHLFEAWFRDGASFEKQSRAGEVICPICGNTDVVKAPMAPNIAVGKGNGAAPPGCPDSRTAAVGTAMKMLRELRREIERNSDHVGPAFAEEARKIHYGETERRNIHGEASRAQARELKEEGVPFSVIPWVPRGDG